MDRPQLVLIPPLQCPQLEPSHSTGDLPSREELNQILDTLDLATPRPRNRLITRTEFNRLLSLMQQSSNPESNARSNTLGDLDLSKFSISPRPAFLFGKDLSSCYTFNPDLLLMYQDRIVAVDDILHDILCFCHLASDHGDEEATNALIQEHYAFVPVDTVGKFVERCRSCAKRRLAKQRVDDISIFESLERGLDLPADSTADDSPSLRPSTSSTQFLASESSSFPSLSEENGVDQTEDEDLVRYLHFERTLRTAVSKIELPLMSARSAPGVCRPTSSSAGSMERILSLPMSREVSLYQGIPNGWQYHFPDYESALNEFVKQQDDPPVESILGRREIQNVPRIPSVAPLSRDRINNTLGAGIGDGSGLAACGPVILVEKEIVQQEVLQDDLLDKPLVQNDQAGAGSEVCKENTIF
ncbi:hypothetical protein V5O48_002777 [Marasmius crinis-equi]|uniref:Integrase zinc-binding domain-containing protein n=1 Tax=Marasmius crinis-equi TaxID=585013 RepID=A0ABR3FV53_9AGAR